MLSQNNNEFEKMTEYHARNSADTPLMGSKSLLPKRERSVLLLPSMEDGTCHLEEVKVKKSRTDQ